MLPLDSILRRMTSSHVPTNRSDQFNLRMPEGMRERIAKAAKANARSMNSEMVALLEAGLSREDRLLSTVESIKAAVEDMRQSIAKK